MSRTIKTGLDYFPLDTNLDEKFEMIEAEHGLIGFAIIIKLFQEIYKNGYYCTFDKKHKLLFCKRNNVDINNLNAIINSAVEWNMFTEKVYNVYNILTSAGIQKQYLNITERRKEVIINKNIWLIDNKELNANIIEIDDDIIPINTDIGTQSKGKGKGKGKVNRETPQSATLQFLFANIKSNFTEKELINCEKDFIGHWTEKSNNGKKELWQMKKTFDVNLRFRQWIKNDREWHPKKWKEVYYGIK